MTDDGFEVMPRTMAREFLILLLIALVFVAVAAVAQMRISVVLVAACSCATLGWYLGFVKGVGYDG